jgi:hypothetical protein
VRSLHSDTMDKIGELIDSVTSHAARATLGDDFDVTGIAMTWAVHTGPTTGRL